MRNRSHLSIVLATFLSAIGCASYPPYYTTYVSHSSDGINNVRVIRNGYGSGMEYHFAIMFHGAAGDTEIYRAQRGAALSLIEATWSPGGKRVGLLVCNWGRPLLVGYDLAEKRSLDGSQFISSIEEQLRVKYKLAKSTSPVEWACSPIGGISYKRQNGSQ